MFYENFGIAFSGGRRERNMFKDETWTMSGLSGGRPLVEDIFAAAEGLEPRHLNRTSFSLEKPLSESSLQTTRQRIKMRRVLSVI